MASAGVRFQSASDRSLLIQFEGGISPETSRSVAWALHAIERSPPLGLLNLHPAYCSLLLVFDPVQADHGVIHAHVEALLARSGDPPGPNPPTLEIPVCYGGEFGPDLEDVAILHSLTPERAVELHAGATYTVAFLGFAPGFPYLIGLPESLATPRLDTPRKNVPAGSVGIAGFQTGIYPIDTPGGWRIIGRTPLRLFEAQRTPMSLCETGATVRFSPIPPSAWAVDRT